MALPRNAPTHRGHLLRHFLTEVALGSAAGLLIVVLVHFGYLESLELLGVDAVFAARRQPPTNVVKLITAKEEDFAAYGAPRLPERFPRRMLAELVTRVAAARPAVICLDVLLEPQAPAPTPDEQALRRAIVRASDDGVPVVVACTADEGDTAGSFPDYYAPPAIAAAAEVCEGPAHEARYLLPRWRCRGEEVAALTVAAYEQYREGAAERGGAALPPPPEERVPIRFWPREQLITYPARQVLAAGAGALPADWLRDCIVLIGREDAACDDVMYVPLPDAATSDLKRDRMFGPEVQANCLAGLLTPPTPRLMEPHWAIAVEVAAAVVASLGVLLLGSLWGNVLAAIAIFLLGAAGSCLVFAATGYVLNILPTLLAVSLTSLVGRNLEQRRLRRWLGAMVSPPVARALGHELSPQPGKGSIENLVLLDFDLRHSSRLAMELPPGQFGPLLNELMARVSAVVLEHEGIINKYLGDGLLAFWTPDREGFSGAAERALAAAVAVSEALADFAPRWHAAAGHSLAFASAVHYGPAWLGFVGLPHRLEYTALGRTVSDCFALQEIAAAAGAEIIVSEAALQAAQRQVQELTTGGVWHTGALEGVRYHQLLRPRAATPEPREPRAEAGS